MSSARAIACLMLLVISRQAIGAGTAKPRATPIDVAFNKMYNFDFTGAHAALDQYERENPSYALVHSVRAVAILFAELDRMRILATEFFSDDDTVTDRKLKADPAVRVRVFKATAEARRLAAARLQANPSDTDAMFAMCMAASVETDYTILIEKRYLRSFALSRESQAYAHKLLAMNPPMYDAYLTLGMAEYVVGSMNFFFRLFVRFDKIKGSKEQGVENLKLVVAHGRYYGPFARILLSVIHLRNKQPGLALPLLVDLQREYPDNPLIRKEVARVRGLVERASRGGSPAGGR